MLQLELDDFVANNAEDFVIKGLRLAYDISALAQLRMVLRMRFEQSAKRRPELIAKRLSYAFRLMWQRWCDNLPPMTIDVTDTQISTADSEIES